MVKKNYTLNIIFYALISFTLLITSYIGYQARIQNSVYKQTQLDFFKGLQLYQQGNTQEALKIVKKTIQYYPGSYQVTTVYAQMLYSNEQFDEALKYMKKAEKLYPAIVLDDKFLLEHAKVLIANGQYGDAKLYLQQVSGANIDTFTKAREVLTALEEYEKQGGL